VSEKTRFTPARSAHRSTTLSPEMSTRIIQTCRKKGITFGSAYPIIAQVAAARLLLGNYLQWEIDEDEWDFRKKEPMYSIGPVNLRPLLEPGWLSAGGSENICVAIGFYNYSIPFLPLGQAAELKPGMPLPEVGNLLTRERFFYRAKLVQKQAKALLKSPLTLEIGDFELHQYMREQKEAISQQRARTGTTGIPLSDRTMTPMEQAAGFVALNGGSSIGNVSCDSVLPLCSSYQIRFRWTSSYHVNTRRHLTNSLSRLNSNLAKFSSDCDVPLANCIWEQRLYKND